MKSTKILALFLALLMVLPLLFAGCAKEDGKKDDAKADVIEEDQVDPNEVYDAEVRDLGGHEFWFLSRDAGKYSHLQTNEIFAEEKSLALTFGPTRCVPVWNKVDAEDLPPDMERFFGSPVLPISALNGTGLDALCNEVRKRCLEGASDDEPVIAPNLRQMRLLKQALETLRSLRQSIRDGMPPDICGLHLEQAAADLSSITGLDSTDETLNTIFSSFCIGK